MALESGTFIDSLNASNPVLTDGLAQADDHMRLIKSTVKATSSNIAGAVTATTIDDADLTASRAVVSISSGKVAVSAITSTELGHLDCVTRNVLTQINNIAG